MAPLQRAARYFSLLFHPLSFLFASTVVTVAYEWEQEDDLPIALWNRWLVFTGVTTIALVPVAIYVAVRGAGIGLALSNSWPIDVLTGTSLAIGGTLTFMTWRKNRWGRLLQKASAALIAVLVPHVLISPFWNISGHVAFALMPALFLTLVDRKFWPLLLVPILTVPARSITGAHTWLQSVAGLVSGTVMTVAAYHFYDEVDALVARLDLPNFVR